MSDQIYALVDIAGNIVNRVVGVVTPPGGLTAILEGDNPYAIGGTLIQGVYTPPYVEPPVPRPITQVTPVQGRIALLNAGLLDQAQAAVNSAGGSVAIWWDYATTWERSHPLLTTLGAGLGLTPDQIDQLFLAASQIK